MLLSLIILGITTPPTVPTKRNKQYGSQQIHFVQQQFSCCLPDVQVQMSLTFFLRFFSLEISRLKAGILQKKYLPVFPSRKAFVYKPQVLQILLENKDGG